jgi:DNA phosphorothioation-associated putative methyltransferase
LGYVVNVIESIGERDAVLREAWTLAERLLIVAARLDWDIDENRAIPCNDGVITARGTFQKFFAQNELRNWIETTLQVEADAAGPGVFYIFRTPEARELHLARGVRRANPPRIDFRPALVLEQNRELLEPLLSFLTAKGRAPLENEVPEASAIVSRFGSIARAIRLLSRVIETRPWEQTAVARQRDLLVYLALGTFRRRPPLRALPSDLQADIRALFGSYSEATKLGREVLFAAGQEKAVSEECARAGVGKLTPDALYVHVSAVPGLPVLLRVYEGCAHTLLGEIPHATLVKLRRDKPKVSYLCYPTFDTEAHPALTESFVADLKGLNTRHHSYSERENPPVLHRKDCFVTSDYPRREVFVALTEAEEAAGLLDEAAGIGTRQPWEARLGSKGWVIEDHKLRPISTL